jgi:hypothetical protein
VSVSVSVSVSVGTGLALFYFVPLVSPEGPQASMRLNYCREFSLYKGLGIRRRDRRQPHDRDCSSGDGRCDGDVCLSLEEVRINIHQRLVHRLISGRHTAVGDLADFQGASDEHTLIRT